MAKVKDIKINFYPKELLDMWVKNNNPLTSFIYTKKIKGFVPKQDGYLHNDLFTINTKDFNFQNDEEVKKSLISLYNEFEKTIDIKKINTFFLEIFNSQKNKEDWKTRQEKLDVISDKYTSNVKLTNSLITYFTYIFFSSTNFASCYFFNETRSKKIAKINSTEQRFLIKNQILILSTILKKTQTEIINNISNLFKGEVKKEEIKKEISLFNKQIKVYNTIFKSNQSYDLKFFMINPRFMAPLFNVPIGTEITGKKTIFLFTNITIIFLNYN